MNLVDPSRPLVDFDHTLLCGQYARVDELNNRLYVRNVPETMLRPNLETRSVPTRCVEIFPALDARKVPRVPIQPTPDPPGFAPITTQGPVAGYLANVDLESHLRNQYFALQHGAPQGVYVPEANSDLYIVPVPTVSHPVPQTHPRLFANEQYHTTENAYIKERAVGNQRAFNNGTRPKN